MFDNIIVLFDSFSNMDKVIGDNGMVIGDLFFEWVIGKDLFYGDFLILCGCFGEFMNDL